MNNISVSHLVSDELLLDENFDYIGYIRTEIMNALSYEFYKSIQIGEFELLYGEGSYEEFIFGGGAGL